MPIRNRRLGDNGFGRRGRSAPQARSLRSRHSASAVSVSCRSEAIALKGNPASRPSTLRCAGRRYPEQLAIVVARLQAPGMKCIRSSRVRMTHRRWSQRRRRNDRHRHARPLAASMLEARRSPVASESKPVTVGDRSGARLRPSPLNPWNARAIGSKTGASSAFQSVRPRSNGRLPAAAASFIASSSRCRDPVLRPFFRRMRYRIEIMTGACEVGRSGRSGFAVLPSPGAVESLPAARAAWDRCHATKRGSAARISSRWPTSPPVAASSACRRCL